MGKLIKVLTSLFILISIVVGGAIFYVTTKIKPEDIKKIAIDATEKALPGTDVKIKSVDYSIGTSFTFQLDSLEIKLKDKLARKRYKNDFFVVKKVEVKVPLWALITNGGTISVNVQAPEVAYNELGAVQSNISLAMGPKKTVAKVDVKAGESTDNTKSSGGKIKLPAFVENSKINIKLTDVLVKYSLHKSISGQTKISRILLKNINLKTPSAFEIASNIKVNLDKTNKFSTSLLVIGDLDLKAILDKGEVNTNVHISLSKIKMTSLPIKIPDVKTVVKVNLNKNGNVTADVKVNIGSISGINLTAKMTKESMSIQKLKITTNLENAVKLMPELRKSLKDINLNDSEFVVAGDVEIFSKTNKMKNNITFGLTKAISMKLIDGLSTSNTVKGYFRGKDVNLAIKTAIAGGEIATTLKTRLDPLKQSFEPAKLSPILVSIVGGNMKFTKQFIKKTLYKSKKGKPAPVVITKNVEGKNTAVKATKIILPVTKTTFDLRQIYVDKSEAKFTGNIHTKGNKAYSKDLKFSYDKGKGGITFNTTLVTSAIIKNKFTFFMKGLDFSSFNAFLPEVEMIKGLEGFFNGKVKGRVGLAPNKLTYNVNVDVAATDAKVHGLASLKQTIEPHLAKVKLQSNDIHIPDNFDSIKYKGVLSEKDIKIIYSEFRGPKHTLDFINIKGNVSMVNKPSKIDWVIKLKNPTKVKKFKKKFGTDSIAFRLKGKGFALGLDNKHFTRQLGKMAKSAVKAKVKSEVKKQVEKKLKKKVKKKFKKLFKKFKF
jgi:hypothetical protein